MITQIVAGLSIASMADARMQSFLGTSGSMKEMSGNNKTEYEVDEKVQVKKGLQLSNSFSGIGQEISKPKLRRYDSTPAESGDKVLVLCGSDESLKDKQWKTIIGKSSLNTKESDVYAIGLDITETTRNLKMPIGSPGWVEKMHEKFQDVRFSAIIDEYCTHDVSPGDFDKIYEDFLLQGGYWYMNEVGTSYIDGEREKTQYFDRFWGISTYEENGELMRQCRVMPAGCIIKFPLVQKCRCQFLLGTLCQYPENEFPTFKHFPLLEQLKQDNKCSLEFVKFNFGSFFVVQKKK